jgi:hypothetical protein
MEKETPQSSTMIDPAEPFYNKVHRYKVLNQKIENKNFPYTLKGLKNIHITEPLSGEYSINKTWSNYDLFGGDLGIPFDNGKEIFIAFGDSESRNKKNWRSNLLAVTTDRDPEDGILFDYMITEPGKKEAKEIIKSLHQPNGAGERTVIPTGGMALGDALYLCFMSVRQWGDSGKWDCNYGGIAKSVDMGQTWEKLENLKWDGTGLFAQMYPAPAKSGEGYVQEDGYIYFFGITGGRFGPAALMRVRAEQIEDKASYEYLTALGKQGPVYQKGEEAEKKPYHIIESPNGEISVMYNPYVDEWLLTNNVNRFGLAMRSSKTLEGPWSPPHVIATGQDYPGLYCAFMLPAYTAKNGRIIYFMTSFWHPVYNVSVVSAELVK